MGEISLKASDKLAVRFTDLATAVPVFLKVTSQVPDVLRSTELGAIKSNSRLGWPENRARLSDCSNRTRV